MQGKKLPCGNRPDNIALLPLQTPLPAPYANEVSVKMGNFPAVKEVCNVRKSGFQHSTPSSRPAAGLALAVETSGRVGSVAVGAGEKILAEKKFSGPMCHSAEIFPSISRLLQDIGHQPDEIARLYISIGPGSFTGLRIAVALAKAWHLARRVELVAVDTLDAIAANIADYADHAGVEIRNAAAVLDAKRGQFFVAAYRLHANKTTGRYHKVLDDCLMRPAEFLERFVDKNEPIYLAGEGLLYYQSAFESPGIEFVPQQYWCPRAAKVYRLGFEKALRGVFADPLTLQPAYIRRPEAEEKWKNNRK